MGIPNFPFTVVVVSLYYFALSTVTSKVPCALKCK